MPDACHRASENQLGATNKGDIEMSGHKLMLAKACLMYARGLIKAYEEIKDVFFLDEAKRWIKSSKEWLI